MLGLVNGLDTTVWNPATDNALPLTYDSATFGAGKAAAKAALQGEYGLQADAEKPLFGLVSRCPIKRGST